VHDGSVQVNNWLTDTQWMYEVALRRLWACQPPKAAPRIRGGSGMSRSSGGATRLLRGCIETSLSGMNGVRCD
jgi:hypothetical protein